jgi:hypothetical protein
VIERFERACVLWCCVTISKWSEELQSNFVSNWVKVLPKLMNCYKKRMEVILCLFQRHLNGLNDFERVGSRWRMAMEKSRVKTMSIVFFDAQGVIRREFVPEGQTVNGQFYLHVMERLLKLIHRVRPELHNSKEWFLLRDNAPAHTAGAVARCLARKQVTVLHHPSYSPDLAPGDFFLFSKLKSQLKGKRFQDISTIPANVTEQIRIIPKDSFKKSFQSLYERCKSCIDRQGDYVQH